jgi:hypothetical protein
MAFTRQQIEEKITKISNAIDSALEGKTYSIDTGQGRMSVTRADLPKLRQELEYWENRLDKLAGNSGPISLEFNR